MQTRNAKQSFHAPPEKIRRKNNRVFFTIPRITGRNRLRRNVDWDGIRRNDLLSGRKRDWDDLIPGTKIMKLGRIGEVRFVAVRVEVLRSSRTVRWDEARIGSLCRERV